MVGAFSPSSGRGVSDVVVGSRLGSSIRDLICRGWKVAVCFRMFFLLVEKSRGIHLTTALCPASYLFCGFIRALQAGRRRDPPYLPVSLLPQCVTSSSPATFVVITRTTPPTEACSLHVSLECQSRPLRVETRPHLRQPVDTTFFLFIFIVCHALGSLTVRPIFTFRIESGIAACSSAQHRRRCFQGPFFSRLHWVAFNPSQLWRLRDEPTDG
ncbi:hypothetical protein QBC39DRAFT_59867 [Podospora conica]|nr:hypothetical protein QBC39DRAFT_59867 [Schizothecium conicum]